ncbi:hypothetical protein PsorP6_009221 [Peronosclerospora sorghi]|uniref:Uncharacterized protein n=1 Tax=Peronosclerospora sorghi TaxID=230839 RepID=A0ACC0VY47_9STRA|nr:hypothetical protein PsorP6_009221 [Peronosclerospora sorghi]
MHLHLLLISIQLLTRYYLRHYLGAFIALGGSVVIFVSDYSSSANGSRSREVRGDLYALLLLRSMTRRT